MIRPGSNPAMANPIIVALDVEEAKAALALAQQLAPVVGAVKVGSELFTSAGPEIVRCLRTTGTSVFLDLKYHDIPHTVAKAVAAAVRWDVQMLTVHTSGGRSMLEAAEHAAQNTARELGRTAPLVLGVTVLTSFDREGLSEIGCEANVARQVERLATLAVQSGLRGLVCSPLEVVALRQILPPAVQLVTPGVRTEQDQQDDQRRTMTPQQALAAGANWLVIGRPIYKAPDPRAACERILASIKTVAP